MMKIKVTEWLDDLPQDRKPKRGGIYEIKEVIRGSYKPQENCLYVIEVNGHDVSVSPSECIVLRPKGQRR